MNVYKLIAKSDLYIAKYTIRCSNITEASKQARIKFARSFHVFGDNVKISLDPSDLKNHIDEIMNKLYKGDDVKC